MLDGQTIGALSVIDSKPRRWSEEQIETLRSLASVAVSTIAYRSATRAAARAQQATSHAERQASAPAKRSAEQALGAADTLAGVASEYFRCLDAYHRFIREFKPTPETLQAEAEYRTLVLDAEEDLKRAAREFQSQFGVVRREPGEPATRAAAALWQACTALFEAQGRRAEASARFHQLKTTMAELEHECVLALQAEQEVRAALRAYETIRDG